jgi:hypothetical protein
VDKGMKGEPRLVKELLRKAKDAAMIAVEFYNKPAVVFKSEGYITLMLIAWTAAFHAYFIKNKSKPFCRKENGKKRPRFKIIEVKLPNGETVKEKKWWDISECIKNFFGDDNNNPIRKNLEFFIPLRNMIVHRNLPELDDSIYGECQASLINFSNFLEKHFGKKHSIGNFLPFSLQLARSPKNLLEASADELKKKDAQNIVNFIKSYRSLLTTEQFGSPEYSFKAILIRVKSHESKDTLPIKFVKYDELDDAQKEKLHELGIILVKEKQIKVEDTDLLKEYFSYSDLVKFLRNTIPDFKQNNNFYDKRKEIIKKYHDLVYIRALNPNNPKSSQQCFYKRDIIQEFKKLYAKNNR